MRSLYVVLPVQPVAAATEFAYALSGDGRHVDQHGSAAAALLPAPIGAGAQVIAIAPARALSWHRVELPKGTSAASPRLRAVLEGLLEDRLLDEPESVHFAVAPRAAPGAPVWVAVCERAWLRDALQLLEAAGRTVTRVLPEFAPEGELVLHAFGEPGEATLAATSADGVLLLPLSTAAAGLLGALPEEGAPLVAEPAVAGLAEQLLKRPVTLQQPELRWLQAAQSGWDLAQGEFSTSGRARTWKKMTGSWAGLLHAPHWAAARWALLALLVLNGLGLNAWAWKERLALQEKRDAVRAMLTTTFPQVKVVVDAPVQMEKEVAALRQATGAASSRDLEAMLGALAAAVPADRAAAALEFGGTDLRVRGLALAPPEFQAVAMNLKGQGYAVRQDGDALVLVPEAAP